MRIRLLLFSLIIVGLALSCQSAPGAGGADGAAEDAAGVPAEGAESGPGTEQLQAQLADLRRENRELTRRLSDSGQALDQLESALGEAVAPEEPSLSREQLLGRARALRQENEALRRVIDELLYLDTLGGVDYAAPRQSEPIPELPPGTTRRLSEAAPQEPPQDRPPADRAPAAEPAPGPAIAVPGPTTVEPPAAQSQTTRARPQTPVVAPLRERRDGFLETEVLAVPPRSAPGRQRPPLGEVMFLRLVDDSQVAYVDRRANFLSESPMFLALEPAGNRFALTFWAIARYPGSEPPLRLRSLVVRTPGERYLFEPAEEQLRRYLVRGDRVELFSQPFDVEHSAMVEEIAKADAGAEITVTFVGFADSVSYRLSQSDRDAMLNLVYAYRAAGGRLP